ncbi:hypothetical protein BHM03_00008815, partial [Ensete ventricosum]
MVGCKVCNFDLYRPVRAVHTGPPGYRYADRLRSISAVGGRSKKKSIVDDRSKKKSIVGSRLREKLTVGSRLRKKKGRRRGKEKKRRGEERIPRSHAVLACPPSLPAGRPQPLFLPREETECLPAQGERSRR